MTFAKWYQDNRGEIWWQVRRGWASPADIKALFEACWHDGYKIQRSQQAVFDPVCRICGDPLTTSELICSDCRNVSKARDL